MKPSLDHVLDNPAWHALTGPHARFAISRGKARHYPRDMVPFSAIEEPSAEAYRDLAVDLPPGTEARLHRLVDEGAGRRSRRTRCCRCSPKAQGPA